MSKVKTKEKRPLRDEFELEELAYQLGEAKEENREVSLIVWKKSDPVQGKITKMDGQTKLIHVSKYGETKKIPFMDILSVESVRV